MHGLINRSIQCFIRDTYGAEMWRDICREAELGFEDFEAMLTYDPALTDAILAAASRKLASPRAALLEDMGTYLVSHPSLDALRRLLRFGGETYHEFLLSLDDLHDRATLALPDLSFPHLELREHAANSFTLVCRWTRDGFGAVMLGVLRAMADDYGALVILDHAASGREGDIVSDSVTIALLDADFAEGRGFDLGAPA